MTNSTSYPPATDRPASRKALKIKLDYLTFMIDVVTERAKADASTIYERECGVGLRELRLMRFIGSEPGLTLTQLIERTSLEKTLASKAITALVKRGLVRRSIGTLDARHVNLDLTDAGIDVVMQAEPIGRVMEAAFRSTLDEEEQIVFRRCLEKLAMSGGAMREGVESHLNRSRGRSRALRAHKAVK